MSVLGLWLIFWFGEPWRISLGDLEIYETVAFGNPIVAVADDGSLLFREEKEARLVFADAQGSVRARVGGKGRGPGEFQILDGLGWVQEQQAFFATDRGNNRISKFTVDGRLLEEIGTDFMRGPVFGRNSCFFLRRSNKNGVYTNEILAYSLADRQSQPVFSAEMEMIATIMPWHGHLVYAPGPEFLVAAHSDIPEIHLLEPGDGKERDRLQLELPRIPITKEFLEPYMKDFMARAFGKGDPPKGFTVDHREEWPYFQEIRVDTDSRIWVFLYRNDAAAPTPYRVYTRKGALLKVGTVHGLVQVLANGYLFLLRESETDTILVRESLKTLL